MAENQEQTAVETEQAAEAKKPASRKTASPKAKPATEAAPASAPEVTPKAGAATKSEAPTARAGGATVTVTQVGSPIGRYHKQRDTLKGLGLNKLHRTRTLEDTPSVRGMINSVAHLVRVGDAK